MRYTPREIADMMSRGEDMSDEARALAKSDVQLAADTATDSVWEGIDEEWLQTAELRRGPTDTIEANKQ